MINNYSSRQRSTRSSGLVNLLQNGLGAGRWGPPYRSMFASDFWKRPVFVHWLKMLERGRQSASPGTSHPAVGEISGTHLIGRMMHHVLVENWEVEKAVAEAHRKAVEIYARHQAG